MVSYERGVDGASFHYTVMITFNGDIEPFTASFDRLDILNEIAAVARGNADTTIRSILIENNNP
jgi:hypothetical protein